MSANGAFDVCQTKNDNAFFCRTIEDFFGEANLVIMEQKGQLEKECKTVTTECPEGNLST